MLLTNEPYELGMWNVVFRYNINRSADSIRNIVLSVNSYKCGDSAKYFRFFLQIWRKQNLYLINYIQG
jgi:hypothetical protein